MDKIVPGSAYNSVFHWAEQQGGVCSCFVRGVFLQPGCYVGKAMNIYCCSRAESSGFKSAKHIKLSGNMVFANAE